MSEADFVSASTPYVIQTPRLVLRPWDPGRDAASLIASYTPATLAHLRPWMPWAWNEPTSLEAKVAWMRTKRGLYDLDRDYTYGVFDADGAVVGGAGLHRRGGEGVLEIGYWIQAERTRQGFATEVASVLTRVAFDLHAVERVEIRCDPLNRASAAIPKKLGFVHEGTHRSTSRDSEGRPRDTMVWGMLVDEYAVRDLATVEYFARDVSGRAMAPPSYG